MSNQKLYDQWSSTYDSSENKTRDLEAFAARKVLNDINFQTALELGCGTGKNTVWLAEKAKHLTAVDLSEEMQARAKQKVKGDNVDFKLADITESWNFVSSEVDLITCSLILEHVENLNFIFGEAARHLKANGHFYVCELHPFRQYSGSKARFETATAAGLQTLECYTHHVSDYTGAARANKFSLVRLNEWFDEGDRTILPRLVSFLFQN